MAEKLKKTDVVVIGLGAGGGTAVLPLARAGLKIVGLEAGPRLTARDFPFDEIRNDIRDHMGNAKANHEVPTSRADASQVATRPLGATGPMLNAVGGTSLHWMTQSWRFLPWNFESRSKTIERYGAGALPAGTTLTDWPFTYAEFEPYYDKAERMLGISGFAGNLRGKLTGRGNRFEGPRQREYPMPPMREAGWTKILRDGAESLGWHPFFGPTGVHTKEYKGLPACTYCGFCGWTGCYTDAKASTMTMTIPPAEKTGNLKVVPNARVTKINVDANGRATGVTYIKGGRSFFQPAKLVILSTYVYENTRLLLLSTSKAYPNGLSNNHGQVGKNYMAHGFGGASINGLFPDKLNRYGGSLGQYTAVDEWDADNFDHTGLGFISGGNISGTMEAKPIGTANTVPPDVPRWGSEWKAWLKKNSLSVGGVFAQVETFSYEDNYLDLDPTVKDPLGYPVIRVTFNLHANEVRASLFLQDKVEEWMKASGAVKTWGRFPPFPVAVTTHAYGSTRRGTDPETSVVDKFGLSHEVPNLAIIGGSTFCSTTGRNPTETIYATAIHTAEHIVKNWKTLVT